MPDCDEVRVEAHGEPDTAELVAWNRHTWSACCPVGPGRELLRALTLVQSGLELLANGHQLHSGPEVWPDILAHAEGPTSAEDVAPVLPYGLEALLEQVEGLAHLYLVDGGVVGIAPEVLDGLDLGAELLELCLVLLAIVCLLVVCLLLLLLLPVQKRTELASDKPVSWKGGREPGGRTCQSRRSSSAG